MKALWEKDLLCYARQRGDFAKKQEKSNQADGIVDANDIVQMYSSVMVGNWCYEKVLV